MGPGSFVNFESRRVPPVLSWSLVLPSTSCSLSTGGTDGPPVEQDLILRPDDSPEKVRTRFPFIGYSLDQVSESQLNKVPTPPLSMSGVS